MKTETMHSHSQEIYLWRYFHQTKQQTYPAMATRSVNSYRNKTEKKGKKLSKGKTFQH